MNWFRRKNRRSGDPEIRDWEIRRSGDQGPDRISGYPDTRITGTARSQRLTSYLLPLTSALFTAFLMIHTAAVLSSPQNFTSGPPYGQTDWTVEDSNAATINPSAADSTASVWLEISLTKTLDKRDNFIHKAWYSRVSFWLTAMS